MTAEASYRWLVVWVAFAPSRWRGWGCVVASIERTAYPRFRRMISGRELDEVFTPTQDEVSWARARTTTEQHRLALLVWLKCYQRLG
jgi:hypothetical protein